MIEDYEKEIQNKLNIFFDFFYDPKENMGELSRLYNLEYKDKMAKKGFVFGKNGYVRSPLEYAFALILEKLELRFFTQRKVGDRSFDFYLLDLKVLIELDGKNKGSRRQVGKLDYQAENVLYLPEKARYSSLLVLSEGSDIGKATAHFFGETLCGNVEHF